MILGDKSHIPQFLRQGARASSPAPPQPDKSRKIRPKKASLTIDSKQKIAPVFCSKSKTFRLKIEMEYFERFMRQNQRDGI